MLQINIPNAERALRFLVGLGLALYAWLASAQPNLVFAATGACIAMTGLVGFCPACALAGRRLKAKS